MPAVFKNHQIQAILIICFCLFFTACTPTKYDEAEADRICEEGKVLLDAYLDAFPEGLITDRSYTMEIGSENGNVYTGYYLSHVVTCHFKAGDSWYRLYVDLEDGQLYTDYRMFNINEQIKRQLKPYCEKYGFTGDYEITDGYGGADIEFFLTSHQIPVKNASPCNVLVSLSNVLPVEYCGDDQNSLADQYLKDLPITEFDIEYTLTDDETYMHPGILLDYLYESGNYIPPEDIRVPLAIHEYNIYGEHAIEPDTTHQIRFRNTCITITDGLGAPSISLSRIDRYYENGIEVLYAAETAEANLRTLDQIKWTEQDVPLVITETGISYSNQNEEMNALYLPRIRFLKEPKFANITRIKYEEGNAQEESLKTVRNENGQWVFQPDTDTQTANNWYYFECAQKLNFR